MSVEGVDAAGKFCRASKTRRATRVLRLRAQDRAANILWPMRLQCRSVLGSALRASLWPFFT